MSRSTAAVFPGRNGHNDDRYEEEEKELTAAQIAEHARIRAGINARLAALQAEAKARRSVSAVKGPRLTEKQKKAVALAKRRATLAAKAAAAAEEEEDEEEEAEAETVKAEGGAGSGPAAAAVPMSSANYVAAAAARYAASGLPAAAKKGSVRFFDIANTRNVNHRDGRVLISDRSTRKSTAGKPVVPVVNIRRSRHAANVSALFAKMSSWAVSRDPGYLTHVLSYIKTEPRYLDDHLTAKEKEVLETPGVLAHLQKQAAMVDKE